MVAFDVYNNTLWSIVMMINKVEHDSCSIQVIRGYENFTSSFEHGHYNKHSELLDASIEVMKDHSIPIVVVDFSRWVADILTYRIRHGPTGGVKLLLR